MFLELRDDRTRPRGMWPLVIVVVPYSFFVFPYLHVCLCESVCRMEVVITQWFLEDRLIHIIYKVGDVVFIGKWDRGFGFPGVFWNIIFLFEGEGSSM